MVNWTPWSRAALWAPLGAASLLLILSVWLRWLLSGDAAPLPPGPDEFGGAGLIVMRTVEVLAAGGRSCWLPRGSCGH